MPNSAPIIYLFSGVGSGQLGAKTFSNANFLIAIPTDTGRIVTNSPIYPPGTPLVDSTTLTDTITISGLGTTVFQFSLNIAVLSNGQTNFFKVSLGLAPDELLGVANLQFHGYGLDHSLGPILGPATFANKPYPTTTGNLIFNTVSSAAFQAIMPAVAHPPKPGH